MSPRFRQFLKATFWPVWSTYILLFRQNSHLRTSGWLRSIRKGYPCTDDGQYLPWMNYSVIAFLEERLRPDMRMFEYGAGYSTHFFAQRVGHVVSVEYDEAWYTTVMETICQNVELRHIPKDVDGRYCRAVLSETEPFDLVVVDGRDRVNCVKQSILALSPGGVILLDDSDREKYAEAMQIAKAAGMKSLSLVGMKPNTPRCQKTTIFYREQNCLGI